MLGMDMARLSARSISDRFGECIKCSRGHANPLCSLPLFTPPPRMLSTTLWWLCTGRISRLCPLCACSCADASPLFLIVSATTSTTGLEIGTAKFSSVSPAHFFLACVRIVTFCVEVEKLQTPSLNHQTICV